MTPIERAAARVERAQAKVDAVRAAYEALPPKEKVPSAVIRWHEAARELERAEKALRKAVGT